jgi:CYTH domain-containing protein
MEIERKFLVLSDEWRSSVISHRRIQQGFLAKTALGCVRVRRWMAGASLTIKGARIGVSRPEYEYDIPLEDADQMLRKLCARPLLDKVRHCVEHAGMTWEVDVYCGAASGLVLAEVELERPDQPFAVPRWVGAEVTQDPYYGSEAIAARMVRPVDGDRAPPRRAGDPRPLSRTPPAPGAAGAALRQLQQAQADFRGDQGDSDRLQP